MRKNIKTAKNIKKSFLNSYKNKKKHFYIYDKLLKA